MMIILNVLVYGYLTMFVILCIICVIFKAWDTMFGEKFVPLTMKEEQDKMWKQLQKYMRDECEREEREEREEAEMKDGGDK